MARWDVFHSNRLEIERSLSSEAVRRALAAGELGGDDLIRPAGSSERWTHLSDWSEPPEVEAAAPTPTAEPLAPTPDDWPDETSDADSVVALPVPDEEIAAAAVEPALPEMPAPKPEPEIAPAPAAESVDPEEEDEAAAEFSLTRDPPPRIEQLDLTAMVDVAFQLILFFLVTATAAYYKTLEIPRPNPDDPEAVAQSPTRTIEDLESDFILVQVDPSGAIRIDRELVPAEFNTLVRHLRSARSETGRTGMLLSADYTTLHRNTVRVIDAANEIGLGIYIARPRAPAGAGGGGGGAANAHRPPADSG